MKVALDAGVPEHHYGGMEISPEELRVDIIRTVGGPCSVRVTYLPTGQSATVDDGSDVMATRELAMRKLERLLAR